MSAVPRIQVEVKLHPDVQSLEDEWSGITDPVIRRKLQNRLNQRAARRRKAAQRDGTPDSSSSSISGQQPRTRLVPVHPTTDLHDLVTSTAKSTSEDEWRSIAERSSKVQKSAFVSIGRMNMNMRRQWYEMLLEGRLVEVQEVAERWQKDHDVSWLYPLPSDHLISLVSYNVYRALIVNIALLGLDLNLMCLDDYPSPFLPLSQSANSNIRRLPPALEPTELQKTVAHHPEWDIIPDPDVRDNILRHGEENLDDIALCLYMVGEVIGDDVEDLDIDTQHKNGVIIWGEPWDITGWEVTLGFASKWPFILRNAPRIQNSTNRWRLLRGEDPLDFDRILAAE
ncbi:hypothetical protein A1O3_01035 [Capronia epimyces CBS 606.96]|uniref:BZIP domain-containing protein n=1 Tax=Capronia epimyces CBS 606.96 TaxID=1182542 RepID=W9YIY0_9EURO|nr:uncharacterized protein A1O3_01035 [Capronia epimyces CBS 606.96]EXJ92483.1 hypothetical protein A1O3_01035 [Capronia epimyces CBS 606.96]